MLLFSIGIFLKISHHLVSNADPWTITLKNPWEIFFLNWVNLPLFYSKITIVNSIKIPRKIYFFLGY